MLEISFFQQNGQYQVFANQNFSHALTGAQIKSLFREDLAALPLDQYGASLYQLLFPDGSVAQNTLHDAATPTAGTQIFLVPGDYPELHAIPWEYMHDGTRFITMQHHLLRALPAEQRCAWSLPITPFNIYALLPDPVISDNAPIAVKKAWDDLVSAIGNGHGVKLEHLLPPTLNKLRDRLDPAAFNLIHILCHGTVADEGRGKALLALQDRVGNEVLTPADRIIDTLQGRAAVVVLNACTSALAGRNTLSNLAYALVQHRVPYAVGMQFLMAEPASFILSTTLYRELLKGVSIEEALRQARNSILDSGLSDAAFWAGVPALYTALDGVSQPVIGSSDQARIIEPRPQEIADRQQFNELTAADRLIGRGKKLVDIATELQRERDRRSPFITLHGIGGIGKTSLAAEAAWRSSWAFGHRVLGISLEVLPAPQAFVSRLADYYLGTENIDPQWDENTRRDKVIESVKKTPSILLLDNLETIIDAAHPIDNDTAPDPSATQIESIILNLSNGLTAILNTSRVITGWEGEHVIDVSGLAEVDGADLFRRHVSTHRWNTASQDDACDLSRLVHGHPLAIRLLASEFDRDHRPLSEFLEDAKTQLVEAENRLAAKNLRDSERQKTLAACIDYSVRRLPDELRQTLRAIFLFQNPFLPELAAYVMGRDDAERSLQTLVDRSLLTHRVEVDLDRDAVFELSLYSLHPMMRWYIDWNMDKPEPELAQRHAAGMSRLTAEVDTTYWQQRRSRRLADICFDDMLAAPANLDIRAQSLQLHRLAHLFFTRRNFPRALELYEQALEPLRQVDDPRSVAVTLHSMGDVYRQQRNFPRALELYEQALEPLRQVDDPREVAVTLGMMAQIYFASEQFEQAVKFLLEAYQTILTVNDPHTAQAMAETLQQFKQHLQPERFDSIWERVAQQPQPDWLKNVQSVGRQENPFVDDPTFDQQAAMTAIQAFFNTSDWATARQVLEEQRDILFHPFVETIFQQNIEQAQQSGDERLAQALQMHLDIIRRAKSSSIDTAFAELERQQAEEGAVAQEVIEAIQAFVNAEDAGARKQIWEQHHERLSQLAVEQVFEAELQRARQSGDNAIEQRLTAELGSVDI